jgi:GT2 family glycosyltransferase
MKHTAILILNWNGYKDTVMCLKSLLPHCSNEDYVFIIDNGSTDNSVEEIQSYYNSMKLPLRNTSEQGLKNDFIPTGKHYLVCNSGNLGFGAGNNVVLKQLKALNAGFTLAWLLNNDALVEDRTLVSLKESMETSPAIGAAGSLILNYPDKTTIQCSGVKHYRFFGVSKLINKNKPYAALDTKKDIAFDYLNGASLLLKLEALEPTGYFDERFFLYSEEYDLELRLQKSGYTLKLDLESKVYHKLGGGTSKNRHLFFYYYNTSAILLSKKHFPGFYTFCAVLNLTAITFIRTFPSVKNFKWGIKGILTALKAD